MVQADKGAKEAKVQEMATDRLVSYELSLNIQVFNRVYYSKGGNGPYGPDGASGKKIFLQKIFSLLIIK